MGRGLRRGGSIHHDAADRFARMHQVKALVDVLKGQGVGDQIVDVDFLFHVPIDDLWHVSASLGATKGGPLPHPSGDELEWSGGYFLARPGDTDDHADPPSAVGAFERLAHGPDIADALEAVVGPALGQVHQVGDEIALDVGRVDEMRQPELSGKSFPLRVEVDADDHVGADHPAALDDIEPDPAEAKDDDIGSGLDFGGVDDRSDASRDAATDVADLVERRVLADLGHGDLG